MQLAEVFFFLSKGSKRHMASCGIHTVASNLLLLHLCSPHPHWVQHKRGKAGSKQGGHRDRMVHTWIVLREDAKSDLQRGRCLLF